MALTNLSQVTSSGIHTLSNYSTHNINSTGIITATEFSGNLSNSSGISTFAEIRVTGNLTVEGTTTTLDSNLTEVDRIEVGANSSNPGIAVTQSGSGAAAFFNGGDVNVATGNIALASATPMVVASNGSGHLRLGAGGSEKVRITSAGDMGLGTATPVERLAVVAEEDSSAVDNGLSIYRSVADDKVTINAQGGAANFIADGGSSYIPFRFYIHNGTTLYQSLTIGADGNVGIGENTPGTILHIKKNDATGPTITLENGSNETYINNWGSSGPSGRTNRFEINAVLTSSLALAGQYISLQTGAAGDSNERLRVTSDGKVGIGVTNPDLKLHVNGVNALPSTSGSTPTGHLTLRAKSTSSSHGMFMGVSNAAPWSSWIQAQDANNNATEYPLLLNPNGGNVGIGTNVPENGLHVSDGSSFAAPQNAGAGRIMIEHGSSADLQFMTANSGYSHIFFGDQDDANAGVIYYQHNSGVNAMVFSTNATERLRITSGGGLKFISADSPTSSTEPAQWLNHSGGMQLYASSGTSTHRNIIFCSASNAASERLRITSGGDVGIGDASPNSNYGTNLSVHSTATDGARLKLSDGSTGKGNTDGLDIISTGSIAYFINRENADMAFSTNNTARLTIKADAKFGFNTIIPPRDYCFHSGQADTNIQITNHTTGVDDSAGALIQQDGNDLYIWNKENSFMSLGTNAGERLRITSDGKVGINETSPSYKLHVKETTSASNYVYVQNTTAGNAGIRLKNSQGDFVVFVSPDLRIYDFANSRDRLRISNSGRVGINADPTSYANTDSALGLLVKNGHSSSDHTFLDIQNGASESGRIRFVDGDNGIGGQIYFSHNTARGGVGGNCMGFFTANNALRFQVTTTGAKVHGTTDGVLELDTTDTRGSFIRFQENGSSKVWAGCSEGIGTGGDQDDFGIRATGGFRLRTGTSNSIEIYESGQIALRPLTGGFSTHGATTQYPGASVSIQCNGVGPGTGTNIPQYGLYVDGAHSSNDATLMTGVFSVAKQNVQNSAIGVHGLIHTDWSSYTRKIGGLFQTPCRAPRQATRSFNPGGGMFANTTSTGFANRLASGGPQPNGTTPSNSTYGDNTALWGDCFRSDTDTSSEFSHNIAIKATNRVNHGHSRVGLMIGTVDGNDTSHNRKKVQSVEYYTEDTYQRFYNRNHKKEMNHHEPLWMSTTDGSRNTMNNVWTANYYIQKYQGNNQYSWYFYNTHSSSYARNGRLKFYITWTTGHASGVGEAEYSVAYTVPHSGGTILMRRCTRFHQWSIGGSYYGWNHNPDVKFFHSTSTGTNAGIYMRLEGAQMSFDGYVIQSIKLEALESNYGFAEEASFRWVSHSTPSDAASSAETNYPPSTS